MHKETVLIFASFVNHQILLILTFWTWVFFEQFNTKKMQKLCKT